MSARPGRRRLGAAPVLAALLLIACLAAPATAATNPAALLGQADAAYAAGDSARARALYRAVLAAQPDQSRALFRLSQFAPSGSAESIRLLRRYVALEPGDAWGHMALGDALARAMRSGEALAHYRRAAELAPREADVASGRQRVLAESGRLDALIAEHEASATQDPGNAAVWLALGQARQRAARYAEAADAYARAERLRPEATTRSRLDAALAEEAPSLRPYVRSARDSDDTRVQRTGLEALLPATDRLRLGISGEHASVRDPTLAGSVDSVSLIGQWRPLHALRLDGTAGVARIEQPAGTRDDKAIAALRLRWRAATDGPAAELQWLRQPLVGTTALLVTPVDLTETRLAAELPVAGPLFARLRTHAGRLEDTLQTNHRSNHRFALGYRVSPNWEIQASVGRLAYEAPAANYFAPDSVRSAEIGTYFEVYRFWPLTLVLDAGLGRQQITRHGLPPETWENASRLNASLAWDIRPGTQMVLEFDRETSIASATATTTGADWRATAVMLSLRFGLAGRSASRRTADPASR